MAQNFLFFQDLNFIQIWVLSHLMISGRQIAAVHGEQQPFVGGAVGTGQAHLSLPALSLDEGPGQGLGPIFPTMQLWICSLAPPSLLEMGSPRSFAWKAPNNLTLHL